jgi:hypothetical protein
MANEEEGETVEMEIDGVEVDKDETMSDTTAEIKWEPPLPIIGAV